MNNAYCATPSPALPTVPGHSASRFGPRFLARASWPPVLAVAADMTRSLGLRLASLLSGASPCLILPLSFLSVFLQPGIATPSVRSDREFFLQVRLPYFQPFRWPFI